MTDSSLQLLRSVARHGEALVGLYRARAELAIFGWDKILAASRRRSRLGRSPWGKNLDEIEDRVRSIERALHRTSRLVPGATCIHRSMAGQRMLIRRGLAAKIAIGLRRGEDDLEGHAWLEIGEDEKKIHLFLGESAGYRPIL